MIYRGITADMDRETGVITGTILLAQYAVEGNGKDFAPVSFESNYDGLKYSWDIDKYGNLDSEFPLLEMRGNEDVGIFGPVLAPVLLDEEETDAEAPAEDTVDEEAADEG